MVESANIPWTPMCSGWVGGQKNECPKLLIFRELNPTSELQNLGGTAVREGSSEEAKSEQNVSEWVGTNQEKGRGGGRGEDRAVTLGRARSLGNGRGPRNPAVNAGTPGQWYKRPACRTEGRKCYQSGRQRPCCGALLTRFRCFPFFFFSVGTRQP